jgi:hypothetical protein
MQLHPSRIARTNPFRDSSRTLFSRKASFLLVMIGIGAASHAQETSPPPERRKQPQLSHGTNSVHSEIPPVGLFVMLDKKSIVFPDIAASSARLSTGRKFELFVDNSVSLHGLAGATFGAGLGQAADMPGGYGQGGDGYAKRAGSSMARLASSNFFGTFLLASALHQDPRFFPEREPTVRGSVKYSLERVVVTRNDNGRDVANWSGLLGTLLSESLANVYWPEQDRTAGQTFRRCGTDLAVRAGTNMLREYWPVLFRVRGPRRPPAH